MAQDTEQRLSLRHYPASRSIVLLWLDLVAASLEQPRLMLMAALVVISRSASCERAAKYYSRNSDKKCGGWFQLGWQKAAAVARMRQE